MWDQMSVRNTEHPIIDQEVLKCEKWKQERRLLSVTTLKVSWHPGSCPWFQLDPIISLTLTTCIWGFPGGSADKESTWQCRRRRSHSWVRKIPWRRKWQPTPVFLPQESHGQMSLVGESPWGCKESDMTEQAHKLRGTYVTESKLGLLITHQANNWEMRCWGKEWWLHSGSWVSEKMMD